MPVKGYLGNCTLQTLKSSIKRFATLAVLFLMLSLLAVNTHNPVHAMAPVPAEVRIQQDPASVAAAFDAALNAHDVNAGLNLFADNGSVHDLSREAYSGLLSYEYSGTLAPTCRLFGDQPACAYSGKDRIGDWLRQLALENIQVQEVGNYQVSGNNVTWKLAISIDDYRRLSIAPLMSIGEAMIQGGKIQSLTLSLTTESTSRLSTAFAKSERGQVSIQTNGFLLGLVSLGLIFPAAAVYYISKVRSLFAAVPRLERPWFLLLAGVISLFIALLLLGLTNVSLISPHSLDMVQYLFVVLTGAFILAAMVLMKRVWTIPSSE